MSLIGDSPFTIKGRRACLATFISQYVIAATMLEPTLEEPSKSDNDIHQSRSRSSSIQEESSHQASLMAGYRFPGPSDAPCLVETSTAHGDLLFLVMFSSIGVLNLSGVSSYVSNLVQNSQMSPLPSPNLLDPPQTLPANGRHVQICFLPTKEKLGFPLVGSLKAGPISPLKPKHKRCNPKQNLLKPRSVLKTFLSILSCSLCRSLENIDRRHQLKPKSPLLPWMYKNSMRTLPLDSSRIISHEPNNFCRIDYYHQPYGLLRYSPGFESLPTPSSLSRHRSLVFVCSVLVTPEAKDTFLTSQNLMIVTKLYFADLFAKAFSTHHDLACGNLLCRFCLREPMDLSLMFEACPLWFSIELLIYFDVSNHEVEELVFVAPFWV